MTETAAQAAIADAERRINNGVQQIIARATPPQHVRRARPATINFGWGGGGVSIVVTATDPLQVDIPFASRIVWARLRAGNALGGAVAVAATVDVQLNQFESFGTSAPLYGTGTIPTLAGQSKNDCSLTGWQTNLGDTDTLTARLATFTGDATWITLTIRLRPLEVPIGISGVEDSAGDRFVDASGNRFVFRR